MAVRPSAAEPLFWVSLLVGLVGLPLFVWGQDQGADGLQMVVASAVLLGIAGFGFGAALLLAAYADGGLPPALILAAVIGALAGGLFATAVAGTIAGGLRIFAFSVLVVDAAAMAVAPRAWRAARDAEVVPPNPQATTREDA